jgi:hypothetical protein
LGASLKSKTSISSQTYFYLLAGYDYLMTESAQKTPRQISIENGEQIIITIMVYFVLLEVVTLAVKIIIGQFITIIDAIRMTLAIVSCVYLYKGKNWAKIFLTLGAMLGIFGGVRYVIFAIGNPDFLNFNLVLLLVIAIFNSIAAYYLVFSSDVDEFMKSCKI